MALRLWPWRAAADGAAPWERLGEDRHARDGLAAGVRADSGAQTNGRESRAGRVPAMNLLCLLAPAASSVQGQSGEGLRAVFSVRLASLIDDQDRAREAQGGREGDPAEKPWDEAAPSGDQRALARAG